MATATMKNGVRKKVSRALFCVEYINWTPAAAPKPYPIASIVRISLLWVRLTINMRRAVRVRAVVPYPFKSQVAPERSRTVPEGIDYAVASCNSISSKKGSPFCLVPKATTRLLTIGPIMSSTSSSLVLKRTCFPSDSVISNQLLSR